MTLICVLCLPTAGNIAVVNNIEIIPNPLNRRLLCHESER